MDVGDGFPIVGPYRSKSDCVQISGKDGMTRIMHRLRVPLGSVPIDLQATAAMNLLLGSWLFIGGVVDEHGGAAIHGISSGVLSKA
jgi:hypothetical protein